MFIQVKLLNGFPSALLYEVPDSWPVKPLAGALVTVPLKQRVEVAWVIEYLQSIPETPFAIKKAISIESLPADDHFVHFIKHLSRYYCIDPIYFIKRIRHFIQQKEIPLETIEIPHHSDSQIRMLTNEQQSICDFLTPHINTPAYVPVVLHGVTGSGKTEVYKQLIITTIENHKSVMLLLPEVTLAMQFEQLLRTQLPAEITIYGFHSGTPAHRKKKLWQELRNGTALLIVGVHLPVIMPIANLGLIIIDEEHEIGYQEKKHPKINTKEAALLRAQIAQIPILLGSATPSFSSLHAVKNKGWHFFQLKKRFAGAFPTIKTVLLTDKKQRRNFWISKELEEGIKDRLAKKEQTIIFLNRRGYSFFVQCKECSYIFGCSTCSVSLTLHEHDNLQCHYCNFSMKLPIQCPSCAHKESMLKKGVGTQQMVAIFEKLFPQARIARADLDSTLKKKEWQKTVERMQNGTLDILIGTQTVTKGYHFPKVTLVGIIWADLNLHFPVYNATETTAQQLIQVAGRAGRQTQESLVIVQTMARHLVLEYLNEIDYMKLYELELALRNEVRYPPVIRFAEIELRHEDEQIIDEYAQTVINSAHTFIEQEKYSIQMLGPSKPPIHKIKNIYSRKIYAKSNSIAQLIKLYNFLQKKRGKVSMYFTPNPLQM